jgi:O-antigen ligase
MSASPSRLERIAFGLVAASLGVVQLNLLTAQTLFGVASLLWIALLAGGRLRSSMPAFVLPLGVYAALTLVSSAFSIDPVASLKDSRQLLLFLMAPMVASLCTGSRALRTIDVVIALGSAGALVGIVQFAMFGYDHLNNRPVGVLTHYMTYSGVLMLVTCAAVARLLYHDREWIWPAIAVPALIVALGVTLTRNAWIGTALGAGLLVWLRRPRLLLLVPVIIAIALIVVPGQMRDRARSMFDPNDPASRDRRAMLVVGARMIADHPVFGVGPEMVESVYKDYRPDDYVNETNPHLHNVPLQIAAERGLPALAAWLWFVVVATRDLWRQLRRSEAPSVAAAGAAAMVAMLSAGLFEYNFGDSEFLMLFLGLIALPHAARAGAAPAAPAAAPVPVPVPVRSGSERA